MPMTLIATSSVIVNLNTAILLHAYAPGHAQAQGQLGVSKANSTNYGVSTSSSDAMWGIN